MFTFKVHRTPFVLTNFLTENFCIIFYLRHPLAAIILIFILFLELLQQYVDVTGDVQTASWICVTFMPGELVQANEAAMSWMSSYRSLLSAWNMYKERALFDLACYTSQAIKQVMQQVRQLFCSSFD